MCNTDNLLISIILPVFNRDTTIEYAVKSVLQQTYSTFELIIVDDNSTDRTAEIIKSIRDERIRYYRLDENVGASVARNIGIKSARGTWIGFHDSDDIWHPNKLAKQVKIIGESNSQEPPIVYTSFFRYKAGRKEYIPIPDSRKKEGYIHKELLLGNFITTQSVLLPKAYLEEVGVFDKELPRFQDWELWLRLSKKYPFRWIDEPLVDVYYSEGSISSDQNKIVLAYEVIINKHKLLYKQAGPSYFSNLLYSYGHNLCLAGNVRKGRKVLFLSLSINPVSKKCLLSFLTSLFGTRFYLYIYSIFNDRRLS